MELQNHLGVCKCKARDPSRRDSVSGGCEGHLKMGVSTKWPGDAGWAGAHTRRTTAVPIKTCRRTGTPGRCSVPALRLLSTSSCIASCRERTPVQGGKCMNLMALNSHLKGRWLTLFCTLRGLQGGGEMSRSRLRKGSGSRVPLSGPVVS